MKVFNARYYLVEEPSCLLLSQPFSVNDMFKQLTSACILHHEVELLLRFNDFIQLHNMRVSHYLENVDLPSHALNIANISDFVFFEDFDCYFLSGEGVRSNFDLSKGSLAKIAAYRCG